LGGSSVSHIEAASDDALSSALSNSQYTGLEVFRVARRVRSILTQLFEQPQENKNKKERRVVVLSSPFFVAALSPNGFDFGVSLSRPTEEEADMVSYGTSRSPVSIF
jgi:hypothetical protein